MRLHADRIDHRVRAPTVGQVADRIADITIEVAEIDGVDAALGDAGQPFGHQVDGDDTVAEMVGDACGHVADGPQAQHGDRSAVGDVSVRDRLPGRRQHVGQVDEPRIRWSFRNFDVGELGLRDAQQFGLAAGDFAVELRIAEQRRPHALVPHLGGFTLRVELLAAHVTVPAGDLEGDDDPVPDSQITRFAAHLADYPHRFVTEDVPRLHERTENFVEVEVGPADVRRGDFDDGIGALFDLRVGHRLDAHVALAMPGDSFHGQLATPVAPVKTRWRMRVESSLAGNTRG